MSLFFSMLPVYIFGNLHCIGMCGPLVMLLGKHPFRYFYFLGRTLSFSLAGLIAGGAGAVFNLLLKQYQIPALMSFVFGFFFLILGLYSFAGWQYPGHQWLAKKLNRFNQTFVSLILRDQPGPVFLFGFFTLALPCGQTLLVFSACALAGDPLVGMLNGLAFALLTTPSLFFSMQAHVLFKNVRHYYHSIIGLAALFVGLLSILRGLADLELISHWVISFQFSNFIHIVIY